MRHLAPAEDDFDGWLFSGEHVVVHWTHGEVGWWRRAARMCVGHWTHGANWTVASAADDLWATAHNDGGGGRRGCVAANTRSLLKKKWFSNIYFDNKMFFLLKILL